MSFTPSTKLVRSSSAPPSARSPRAAYQYWKRSNSPAPDCTSRIAWEVILSYGNGEMSTVAPVSASKSAAMIFHAPRLGWLTSSLRRTASSVAAASSPQAARSGRPASEAPSSAPLRRKSRREDWVIWGCPGLGVEGERRELARQEVGADLALLVGDGVVKRVRADVAPVEVQPDGRARGARAGDLEDALGDVERDLRGDDLRGRHVLGDPAAALPRERVGPRADDLRERVDCVVGERAGRACAGDELPVGGEDVRVLGRGVDTGEDPWARPRARVLARGGQGPLRDAEVELDEHELDRGRDERAERAQRAGRERRDEPGVRHVHAAERHAPARGQPLAEVVPVTAEADAVLRRVEHDEDRLARVGAHGARAEAVGEACAGRE